MNGTPITRQRLDRIKELAQKGIVTCNGASVIIETALTEAIKLCDDIINTANENNKVTINA